MSDLNMCCDGHAEVHHPGERCPLCEIREAVTRLTTTGYRATYALQAVTDAIVARAKATEHADERDFLTRLAAMVVRMMTDAEAKGHGGVQ